MEAFPGAAGTLYHAAIPSRTRFMKGLLPSEDDRDAHRRRDRPGAGHSLPLKKGFPHTAAYLAPPSSRTATTADCSMDDLLRRADSLSIAVPAPYHFEDREAGSRRRRGMP